jgi:hypothetical protein
MFFDLVGLPSKEKSLAIAYGDASRESEDIFADIRVVVATVFAVAWGVWEHLYRPSVQ